ncbi:MAG: hypothetical protein IH846_05300 [Acidobacteria bacterium]|nr:hypothetical protein [Acidobacteriota bacterium]
MRTYCFSLGWHRIVLKGFAILFLAPLSGLAQTPSLVVDPASLDFFHQLPDAGIPEEGPAAKTLTVEASNSAALNFTATASVTTPAGVNWLFVNGGSQTSGTTPGTLTVSVDVIGLAHNNDLPSPPYIGTITISADGVTNSPLTVQVTLRIRGDRRLKVSLDVLQFDATGGEEEMLSQGLTLFTVGFHPGPLLYSTTVITQDGGGWLAVSPATGTAPTEPDGFSISATPGCLGEGSYVGSVAVQDTDNRVFLVQVVLTVTLTAPGIPVLCLNPASLLFTTEVGTDPPIKSFQVQNAGAGDMGWSATVDTDTGGNWLSVSPLNGVAPSTLTVTVSASGLAAGAYTGTVTIAALEGSNAANSPQVLAVSLAVGAPVIGQNGIVNGASFSQEAVNSPGSIVSLFGVNLATGTALATELPLPTELLGTQVLVNEVPAPLFFVSPLQINFQIPPGVSGTSLQAVVVLSGVRGLTATVNVAPEVPGIFTTTQQGTGQGAVLLANSDVIAAPVGSIPGRSTRPAARGEIVSIFCTGLGAVDPAVEAGQPAGGSPPSVTVTTPVVLVGGVPGEVLFSGLAPGFVGLYQVNVRIPEAAPVGDAVSLQIQIGGQSSNTATIAVE